MTNVYEFEVDPSESIFKVPLTCGLCEAYEAKHSDLPVNLYEDYFYCTVFKTKVVVHVEDEPPGNCPLVQLATRLTLTQENSGSSPEGATREIRPLSDDLRRNFRSNEEIR